LNEGQSVGFTATLKLILRATGDAIDSELRQNKRYDLIHVIAHGDLNAGGMVLHGPTHPLTTPSCSDLANFMTNAKYREKLHRLGVPFSKEWWQFRLKVLGSRANGTALLVLHGCDTFRLAESVQEEFKGIIATKGILFSPASHSFARAFYSDMRARKLFSDVQERVILDVKELFLNARAGVIADSLDYPYNGHLLVRSSAADLPNAVSFVSDETDVLSNVFSDAFSGAFNNAFSIESLSDFYLVLCRVTFEHPVNAEDWTKERYLNEIQVLRNVLEAMTCSQASCSRPNPPSPISERESSDLSGVAGSETNVPSVLSEQSEVSGVVEPEKQIVSESSEEENRPAVDHGDVNEEERRGKRIVGLRQCKGAFSDFFFVPYKYH
jgi:hypothetical protein